MSPGPRWLVHWRSSSPASRTTSAYISRWSSAVRGGNALPHPRSSFGWLGASVRASYFRVRLSRLRLRLRLFVCPASVFGLACQLSIVGVYSPLFVAAPEPFSLKVGPAGRS
ncbi:hypothetical protein B0H13DRAFT_2342348 [Mycena leptocephala]|nr:hypothetical protein B0H13DRAFT_2342348 [Mycena leptocephala]